MRRSMLRAKIEEQVAPNIDEGGEDEDDGITGARVVDVEDSDDAEGHGASGSAMGVAGGVSVLRARSAARLQHTLEHTYRGKKSSRQALRRIRQGHDPEEEDTEDEPDSKHDFREHQEAELGFLFEGPGDGSGEDDDVSDHSEAGGTEGLKDGGDDDDDDDDGVDDGVDEEADGSGSEDDVDESLDTTDSHPALVTTSSASNVARGRAIKSQLLIWDKLLECRIQMQKILTRVNQLPIHENWSTFVEQCDEETMQRAKTSVTNLLRVLLDLQADLLKTCDDATFLEPLPKKAKVADFSEALADYHDRLLPYRNETIEKWHEKTRLASGLSRKSFDDFESSALKQIEFIMADKSRLIARTRKRRSAYRILGTDKQGAEDDGACVDQQPEIFDDDDFYHQLLRELIDKKTGEVTDPTQLGRQWIKIQKLRAKAKPKVDTKASKGRKTRYDIHSKLVSFMAPTREGGAWHDEARNDLFASLFANS